MILENINELVNGKFLVDVDSRLLMLTHNLQAHPRNMVLLEKDTKNHPNTKSFRSTYLYLYTAYGDRELCYSIFDYGLARDKSKSKIDNQRTIKVIYRKETKTKLES